MYKYFDFKIKIYMSLLSEIIRSDSPLVAKQLAYLIDIIKQLGWDSLNDNRTIKPNLRRTQVYLHKRSAKFKELFGISCDTINKQDVVDIINPILIEYWHIQIIGDSNNASLQLLHSIKKD